MVDRTGSTTGPIGPKRQRRQPAAANGRGARVPEVYDDERKVWEL